jgi:hypothetical protein
MTASAKAVVERLTEEVWNRGDLDVIDELVAETFVDNWALAGERDGREGLRELVRHVREAFPDFHITRFEVIGRGQLDRRALERGRHSQGAVPRRPADGRRSTCAASRSAGSSTARWSRTTASSMS